MPAGSTLSGLELVYKGSILTGQDREAGLPRPGWRIARCWDDAFVSGIDPTSRLDWMTRDIAHDNMACASLQSLSTLNGRWNGSNAV